MAITRKTPATPRIAPTAPPRAPRGGSADRAAADVAVGHRIERIRGQLAGVRRMLDEGRECADVVVQLMAVRAAVEKVASTVVLSHVDECLDSMSPARAKRAVADALQQLGRLS